MSSAHRPQSWGLRLRRPSTLMGEGRPPRRPHIRRPWEGRPPRRPHFHVASGFIPRLCPWVRSVLAIRPGVKPVATSASGGMTSASSAFPRSERVYPAIMPLGAISPGVKPVATSASGGMTSASSAHYPESWRLPLRRPCTLMGEG